MEIVDEVNNLRGFKHLMVFPAPSFDTPKLKILLRHREQPRSEGSLCVYFWYSCIQDLPATWLTSVSTREGALPSTFVVASSVSFLGTLYMDYLKGLE